MFSEEMENLVPALREWSHDEDEGNSLTVALGAMTVATEHTFKAIEQLNKNHKNRVYPAIKELNRYNDSVSATLQRRSIAQYTLVNYA